MVDCLGRPCARAESLTGFPDQRFGSKVKNRYSAVFAALLNGCSSSPAYVHQQRNDEHDQEDEEQDLGDSRRRGSNQAETKQSRYQRNNQEHYSVIQHWTPPLGTPKAVWHGLRSGVQDCS